ncbi:MAG TPA: HNH endonuclease [Candidatus Polarisedimenticolia bacterium]|nr:HNH endonuclease [Candidatus Polarisedimenticolia bacterium]
MQGMVSQDKDFAGPMGPAAQAIRLEPKATYVPEALLDLASGGEGRQIVRGLAAFLLDRHLRRLSCMRSPLELRLGRLLARLRASSGYLELGFARLADYVTERLGMSARRMQVLLQIDAGLEDLPVTAEAYRAGSITHSQLRLLLRIVTPDTEARWVGRARSVTVRLLQEEIQAAAREAASATLADATATPAATTAPIDEEREGRWESFRCPEQIRGRWEYALEICRASAGSDAPAWQCAEYIAADFLAGVPDLPSMLARGCQDGAASETEFDDPLTEDDPCPAGKSPCGQDDGVDLFEEVLATYERRHGSNRWAPPENPEVILPDDVRDDPADGPRDLDDRLRALIRLRQNLAWQQGRLLRTLVALGLHREIGFLSFESYCRERVGFGLRRARQLIALDRRLTGLPRIADAYRGGDLSWVQASSVVRVADRQSEEAWVRLATSVTVRRLRDEVNIAAGRAGDPGVRAGGLQPAGMTPSGEIEPRSPRLGPWSGVQTCARSVEEPQAAEAGVQTWASWGTVRFWAPDDVARLWRHAIEVCRLVAGSALQDWECVESMLSSFRKTWEVTDGADWQRNYLIYERDGWRCRVPGCSSRRNLNAHHIFYRSQGGDDEGENLVTICATHHHQGFHASRLRCHALPGGLFAWALGRRLEGRPLERFIEDVRWGKALRKPGMESVE